MAKPIPGFAANHFKGLFLARNNKSAETQSKSMEIALAMNKNLCLRIAFVVGLLLLTTGCDIEPPDYVPRTTRTGPEGAGAFAALPSLTESITVQQMQQKGYYKYGTPLAAPYTFVRPGPNDFLGINPNLAYVIAEQLGFPSPLVQLQRWPQMPRDLESGVVDMIIGAPISRPEFQNLAFVPIGERGHCLLIAAEDNRFEELSDITQQDVTISVIDGTDVAYYLEQNYPEVELSKKSVATAEETVLDLLEGEADIAPVYSLATPAILEKHQNLRAIPENCVEQPIWTNPWGISVRDDDPFFLEFLEGTVVALKETDWFEEKSAEWSTSPLLERSLLSQ